MNQAEPPSLQAVAGAPMFCVGRDRQGRWVVRDQQGLRGGLFVDRAEALKFAMFENGNRPQAVIMVAGVLELDFSGRSSAHPAAANTQAPLRQPA
jgi:hypothetical protein